MADLNIGNSSASVVVNAKHNGSVIPQINNTYDLGTSDLRWKNIYSNLKGNADTATKLATARTISLTGSVTGSGTFDGSGNLSITTATNHTHSYAGSASAGGPANSVKSSLTIKLNNGTNEGNNLFTFNGLTAKTINITALEGFLIYTNLSDGVWKKIIGVSTNDLFYYHSFINYFQYDISKTINITPAAIGASASGHIHDDRYYGKSEIDGMLEGKAETEHNHDAYYYRKEEIDEALIAPDWNQNDETAHDYIKNRPFYTDDTVENILVDNVSVTIEGGNAYVFDTAIAFKEGNTYKVEWNGTVYECVAYKVTGDDETVWIGNTTIIGEHGGNGEPFLVGCSAGTSGLFSQEDGTYTISIAEEKSDIHEIDKKYLGYEVITTTLFDGTVLIGAQ